MVRPRYRQSVEPSDGVEPDPGSEVVRTRRGQRPTVLAAASCRLAMEACHTTNARAYCRAVDAPDQDATRGAERSFEVTPKRRLASNSLAAVMESWRLHLGADPEAFRDAGIRVGVRPTSGSEEGLWVRVVRMESSVYVSLPAELHGWTARVQRLPGTTDLVAPEVAAEAFGTWEQQRGPADLFFTDKAPHSGTCAVLDRGHALLAELLAACPPEDVEESSLENVVAPLSVVVHEGRAASASGWSLWNGGRVAHMSVLTRPDTRGQGQALLSARHATARAVESGLVAQWRAATANVGSKRLAARVGYELVGQQLSVRVAEAGQPQ